MKKKTVKEILGFDDRLMMLIGMPASALLLPFLMSGGADPFFYYHVQALISLGYVMLYWFAGRQFTMVLRRKYQGTAQNSKRITLMFIVGISFICLVTFGGKPLFEEFVVPICPPGLLPQASVVLAVSFVISLAVMGIYEAVWSFSNWKVALVETERLRKENIQAQLDTLKSQVNPHFLFNSLNTLSSLVHDEPDVSVEFIQKLSKTYRYILEIRDRELILLEEEMECIHAYLFLLEMRFGDSLKVEIDIPEKYLRYYLAPLSLQLLVENAIKHNVVSRKRPLLIEINVNEAEKLIVRNNLQKKTEVNESTQTGLENIRNRYALLVKQDVEVIEGPEYFTVILPLIKLEKYESADH